MTDHARGLLITTLGVLMIVPDSLFIRLIEADAMTIAFWRSLLSGGVIALGVLAFQGVEGFRAVLRQGWSTALYAVFMGVSGVLFVLAVSLTSVANVVFIIAAMPVFAALFSWLALGERISRRTGVTIAVVMTGLGVIAYGSGETEGASLAGDLVAVGVAANFAAALTVARRVRAVSLIPALPIAFLGAALLILVFARPEPVPQSSWVLVGLHGIVFITVSTALLTLGPRYLPSAEVALLILLESVLAPLLVWAVLGEEPGRWTLFGGAIVVGALAVSNAVAMARRRRQTVR